MFRDVQVRPEEVLTEHIVKNIQALGVPIQKSGRVCFL
jgi:hypothetical protein